MDIVKSDTKKKSAKPATNPFIKAVEDKKKITAAIQNGKNLSDLKDIDFVKPL